MDDITQKQLRKALRRNYWTVELGLRYLAPTPEPELVFHRSSDQLTNEEIHERMERVATEISRLSQIALYEIKMDWLDTDHTQGPRIKSDGPYSDHSEYPVTYFIKWALNRGLKIEWLDWAIKEELVSSDIAKSVTNESFQLSDANAPKPEGIHHRKKNTYLLTIGALLHAQNIDYRALHAHLAIRDLIKNSGKKLKTETAKAIMNDISNDAEVIALLEELRKLR